MRIVAIQRQILCFTHNTQRVIHNTHTFALAAKPTFLNPHLLLDVTEQIFVFTRCELTSYKSNYYYLLIRTQLDPILTVSLHEYIHTSCFYAYFR